MGLGIEARYLRCKAYWKRHLEICRAFQNRHLIGENVRGSIAILGAGRLLDLDLEMLQKRFAEVHLYDADPTVLPTWKKFARSTTGQVHFHIGDVSNSIQSWTDSLGEFLSAHPRIDPAALGRFLSNVTPAAAPRWQCGAILSQNLLSQISIYWRDRVDEALLRFWKYERDGDGMFPVEVEAGLTQSCALLEQQHLDQLSESHAERVIVVSDESFMYYRQDRCEWQCESALHIRAEVALKGYSQVESDSWLWHIAPQGIEQPDYGVIHKVVARAFVRERPAG